MEDLNNNYSILVVDDEDMILSALKDILNNFGYLVFCAKSGEEALKIIYKEDVHLFFLDLNLRGMSGIDLCEKIRKEDPKAFICAMTGFPSSYSLTKCREAGFDDYFTKPIEIKKIMSIAGFAFSRCNRWKKISKEAELI